MSELDRLRSALRRSARPSPWPADGTWPRLAKDPRARVTARRSPLVIAAAVILAGLLAVGIRLEQKRTAAPAFTGSFEERAWFEASETAVQRALSDGTTIALDPGSSGRVADARSDYVRFELERGRAHFEVTRNPKRSFHVAASGYDIRVVGTRFTVAVLAPNLGLSVDVERGSVSVTPPGGAPMMLGAGDRWASHADAPAAANAAGLASAAPPASAARPVHTLPSAASSPLWWTLYRGGRYRSALEAARKIGFPRLTEELDAERLAGLADTARFAGDSTSAILALSALERRFSGTPEAAQATFLLGRVYAAKADARLAAGSFERYLDRYPAGSYATEAIGRLAELYSKEGDRERARPMAERYLQRAPAGPYARLARSLLAQP